MKLRRDIQNIFFVVIVHAVIESVKMIPCEEAAGNSHPVRVFKGNCYEFIDRGTSDVLNAGLANEYCQGKNAFLVDLVDKETQDFLVNTFQTEVEGDYTHALIGVWKDTGKGPWYGPHGNTITYSDWLPGQGVCTWLFDVMCLENYAVLDLNKNKWTDQLRITTGDTTYICQYGIHKKICPFIRGEHQNVKEYNGRCYEFKNDQIGHSSAEAYCARNGGYLVEIPDAQTEKFIVDTIKTFLSTLGWKWTQVLIGAYKDDTNLWRWGNYKQITYSNFTEVCCFKRQCAILDIATKTWSAEYCSVPHFFICQYELPVTEAILSDTETSSELPVTEAILSDTETSSGFSTKQTSSANIHDDSSETNEGIIYTLFAVTAAVSVGTVRSCTVFYWLTQTIKIRKAMLRRTATEEYWYTEMSSHYALKIPEFEDDEQRRLYCLNIPPKDFRYIIS